MGEELNDGRPAIEITPRMIEAAAEELWDWVVFRKGYHDTMPMEWAREEAVAILKAAFKASDKGER